MEQIKRPITAWAEDDRPREKLMLKGKSSLSDAELLAILIGSGTREESAIDLCRRMLNDYNNNLTELARQGVSNLIQYKGIGEAKAISIVAALELGQRRRMTEAIQKEQISCSKEVFELMQPRIGDLSHEEFWIILLSNSNHVRKVIANKEQQVSERFIEYKIKETLNISKGGMTGTVVDLRVLFKLALEHQATGVILVHNHPSGKLNPSDADIQITKKIKEASKIMDISLLDHFIVTEFDYYSFADHGLL
ncbi:MAG: DNA repair protein RadC [Flavobacteriaceae bacterium]|jgi:DNA repair protein RadC|nr:DNA repair protein RadC [Flavobacteriaceae bacterium]